MPHKVISLNCFLFPHAAANCTLKRHQLVPSPYGLLKSPSPPRLNRIIRRASRENSVSVTCFCSVLFLDHKAKASRTIPQTFELRGAEEPSPESCQGKGHPIAGLALLGLYNPVRGINKMKLKKKKTQQTWLKPSPRPLPHNFFFFFFFGRLWARFFRRS